MQPIKIVIEGDFYDSQIYSGMLYLWTMDGDILTIRWDDFIKDYVTLKINPALKFIAYAAFIDASFLYRPEWKMLFSDKEFRKLFLHRLVELQESGLTFTIKDFGKYATKRKNPFPVFPHADSLVFYNTIYVGGRSGVFKSTIASSIRQSQKLWDGGVINMAGAQETVAIAAGQEGVYEYFIEDSTNFISKSEPKKRLDAPANYVNWMYTSLFSSFYGNGQLTQFKKKDKSENEKNNISALENPYPEISARHQASDLFNNSMQTNAQLFWGNHDKLCMANQDSVYIVKYTPASKNNSNFLPIGDLSWRKLTDNEDGEIVSAGSGYFGYVIETEDGLLVIESTFSEKHKNDYLWLEGEPTNWRIFSNSKNYTNQLHVIYDDNVSIFSFNQDYSLNQDTKLVGLSR